MQKLIIFFSVFLFTFHFAVAQNEANYWYFGNFAGLRFNSDTVKALTDGKLQSHEACASISDKYGELLFYTNGVNVWDRFHQQMPNGFGLGGHVHTSQTLIVKKPGSETEYYIFTNGYQGRTGFKYSVVDISLNNGRGDVSEKKFQFHLLLQRRLQQ